MKVAPMESFVRKIFEKKIDESVHISFKSNTKELYIEFYNTGEIAYLIDNSGMVTDIKELVNIVIKFIDGNG
jgi:hypothetical protein